MNPLAFIPMLVSWYLRKQELQLKWYQLIFAAIKDFLAFCWRFWRIILPLAMVCITLIYVHALRVECERNRRIIADKDAQIAQIHEDSRKKATKSYLKAEAAAFLTHQTHQKQLGLILANARSTVAQEIKRHEADNTLHTHRLNAYRDRLRIAVSESARQTDFAGIYSPGANSDAALSRCVDELNVCKEAGALCAADYNYCYGYVKDVRKAYDETQN